MSLPAHHFGDDRREERDEVHHRARASHADGRALTLLLVNISPHGFMARCDAAVVEEDRIHVTLPAAGRVPARVVWSLGGRVGCQFADPVPRARYYELLAALLRG